MRRAPRARSGLTSTTRSVSGSGWHNGMRSEVRLPPITPASSATVSTSPLGPPPSTMRLIVSCARATSASATARRGGGGFSLKRTMRGPPRAARGGGGPRAGGAQLPAQKGGGGGAVGDAGGEAPPHDPARGRVAIARERPQHGADEQLERDEAAHGVAGQAEQQRFTTVPRRSAPERDRFAGLAGDAPQVHAPQALEGRLHHVAGTDRDAAADDDEVRPSDRADQRSLDLGERVAGAAEPPNVPAGRSSLG